MSQGDAANSWLPAVGKDPLGCRASSLPSHLRDVPPE